MTPANRANRRRAAELSPAIVLIVAELAWGLAMLGFTVRVGVPPIGTAGLVVYCGLVIAAITALALGLRRAAGWRLDRWAVLLPLWAAAAYVLSIGWPYRPYGHSDVDEWMPWLMVPLVLAGVMIGLAYWDRLTVLATLLIAATVPLVLALADARQYPDMMGVLLANLERDAGWKGAALVAVALAAVVVVLRAKPRWPAPGTWLGAAVAAIAGGYILLAFGDSWLPRNGEDLGWTRPELSVVIPPDAWSALRPLSANLAALAVVLAVTVLVLGVARWVVGRRAYVLRTGA